MSKLCRLVLCLLALPVSTLAAGALSGAYGEPASALGGTPRSNLDGLFEALAIKRPEGRVIAPDPPLTDTEGKRRSLKDFRGRLVLVNFWATWCRPCVIEMPELERLYAAYKDRGFVVVGISTDVQGPEFVKRYVTAKQFTFPAFSDPDGIRAGIPFRLVGVPASYLIGPDGALLGSVQGARSWGGPAAMELIGALIDAARSATPGPR